jgi:hypothetical protein
MRLGHTFDFLPRSPLAGGFHADQTSRSLRCGGTGSNQLALARPPTNTALKPERYGPALIEAYRQGCKGNVGGGQVTAAEATRRGLPAIPASHLVLCSRTFAATSEASAAGEMSSDRSQRTFSGALAPGQIRLMEYSRRASASA